MKNKSAWIGTLAVSGLLAAGAAVADTSTTSVSTTAPSVLDNMIFNYFGAYYGPSISNPTMKSNSGNGVVNQSVDEEGKIVEGDTLQKLDNTFTLGYKITPRLNLTANYRFFFTPMTPDGKSPADNFRQRDPWVSIVIPKLINYGGFNLSNDVRVYAPVTTSALMYTALRMTQVATFDVPGTRLNIGIWGFERANLLTDNGAQGNMENFSVDVSPFASYQLTPTLAATLWTDVINGASYATVGKDGGVNEGWDIPSADICVGVGWDITPKINFNPQLTIYPSNASLENTTIGGSLSARFL